MIKHQNQAFVGFWRLSMAAAMALSLGLAGCGEDSGTSENGSASAAPDSEVAPPSSDESPTAREVPLGDIVLGSADAPITVIEYASMTCSHCADFHKFAFKRLKENYVDTGKVRFVFREFPLDAYALQAAVLARCLGEDQYFEMVDTLFEEQLDWVTSKNISSSLRRYAREKGLSDDEYDSCQENQTLLKRLAARRVEGRETYGVRATPSLVIDGELYEGSRRFNDLAAFLDNILAQE